MSTDQEYLKKLLENDLNNVTLGSDSEDNDEQLFDQLFGAVGLSNPNNESQNHTSDIDIDSELKLIADSSSHLAYFGEYFAADVPTVERGPLRSAVGNHNEASDKRPPVVVDVVHSQDECCVTKSSQDANLDSAEGNSSSPSLVLEMGPQKPTSQSKPAEEILFRLLNEEERAIISSLMELIVESVERCAPICEVSPDSECSVTTSSIQQPDAHQPLPSIIQDDEQLLLELEAQSSVREQDEGACGADSSVGVVAMAEVLSELLRRDTEALKASRRAVAQSQDLLAWEETNAMKEALEQDRLERQQRRAKREQQRLAAARDHAATAIQCLYRTMMARVQSSRLREVQQQRRAAEEQARMEEQQRRAAAQEEVERRLMAQEHAFSCSSERALREAVERRRAAEAALLAEEDALAKGLRAQLIAAEEARRRELELLAHKQQLMAQEDEDYGLELEDESEGEDEEEGEGEGDLNSEELGAFTGKAPGDEIHSMIMGAASPSIVGTLGSGQQSAAIDTSLDNSGSSSISGANSSSEGRWVRGQLPVGSSRSGVGPSHPSSAQATNRKTQWGGSITMSNCTGQGGLPALRTDPQLIAAATPASPAAGETATSARATSDGEPISIASYMQSDSYQRALHSGWQELAARAHSSPTPITYDVAPDQAVLDCFLEYSSNSSNSTSDHNSSSSNSSSNSSSSSCHHEPPLVQAMRCWVRWRTDHCAQVADVAPSTELRQSSTAKLLKTTGDASRDSAGEEVGREGGVMPDEVDVSPQESGCTGYTGPVDLTADPVGVHELDFCVEDLTDVRFLARFRHLRKLLLNVNKLSSLRGIESLEELQVLSAKDNNLGEIAAVRRLQGLRHLLLDCNRVADCSALDGLQDLRVLSVCSNYLVEVPAICCPRLQRLEAYRNRIGGIPPRSLRGLPSLTHLDLGYNKISVVSGSALSSCPLLQTLILSQNQIRDLPFPLRLPLLKNLWLNGNQIASFENWLPASVSDDAGAVRNREWPLFTPLLQKLYLRDNQINNLDDEVFVLLPVLTELDLSFNALPSRAAVQALCHCQSLTALHIQDNPLTTVRSGTASAALPAQDQALLQRWLVEQCPSLEVVSGSRIQADRDAALLKRTTSIWRFVEHKLGVASAHGNSSPNVRYSETASLQVRQLQHLLMSMLLEQSTAASRERVMKREEAKVAKAAKDKGGGAGEGAGASPKGESCDWEAEQAWLLQNHFRMLLRFSDDPETVLPVVSYVKSCSRMQANPEVQGAANQKEAPSEWAGVVDGSSRTAISCVGAVTTTASYPPALVPLVADVDGDGEAVHIYMDTADTASDLTDDDARVHQALTFGRREVEASEHAARSVQRLFRGHRARRRFGPALREAAKALRAVRYEDTELDQLLLMGSGAGSDGDSDDFNFSELEVLLSMDEFKLDDSAGIAAGRARGIINQIDATAEGEAMVYGDHIRRRKSSHQNILVACDQEQQPQVRTSGSTARHTGNGKGAWMPPPGDFSPTGAAPAATALPGLSGGRASEQQPRSPSRPSTAMSAVSGASAQTCDEGSSFGQRSTSSTPARPAGIGGNDPAELSFSDDLPTARSGASAATATTSASTTGQRESTRAAAARLAQEWGISDPKVLAAMMKRNKRMKGFAHAQDMRAQDKDPQARLQRFLKNAHRGGGGGGGDTAGMAHTAEHSSYHYGQQQQQDRGCHGNTTTSGAFGGKPRTLRTGGGAASQQKRAMAAVPAWRLGEDLAALRETQK